MWRFRLFGFPVSVDWTFWAITILLALDIAQTGGRRGAILLIMWVSVVFGSVLWHELGHAFARKRFGQPFSEIKLYSFGGLCSGPGRFTRRQSFLISAAGPAASLFLGGVTALILFTPGMSNPWIPEFVGFMLWVNVGWAFFNLLPILPLDGGNMLDALLANKNASLVPQIGMILGGVMAVVGLLYFDSFFMAFLFGYLAYGNYQRTKGMRTRFF